MKSAISLLTISLAAHAYAAAVSNNLCKCNGVTITSSGGASGTASQISDGQIRVGDSGSPSKFNYNCNGGITDSNGRGCIITSPSGQFQCDSGAKAASGFSVSADSVIAYNGNSKFYACAISPGGPRTLHTTNTNPLACVEVTLKANGCETPKPPAPQSCPTVLGSSYEFPHLIIPVDSSAPNKAYGTSYNGQVSRTMSSVFNFDIPLSKKGQKCSLIFLLPKKENLQTSNYKLTGKRNITFGKTSSPATKTTNYNNKPSVSENYGSKRISPGGSYSIATFDCPAGQTVSFYMSSTDTLLNYFQDFNPSPIGLYITNC